MNAEIRNATYRRLRAPARMGSYTVGQWVALALSAVLSLALASLLIHIGAPIGLSLTCGVLLAGVVPMVALALEGREFSVPGLVAAAVAWQRTPRRYAVGCGALPSGNYHVSEGAPGSRGADRWRRG